MAATCTHTIHAVPRIASRAALPRQHGLLARAWARLAGFADRLTMQTPPAERIFGDLLEQSGGKLTDAMEREVDRRLQGDWPTAFR